MKKEPAKLEPMTFKDYVDEVRRYRLDPIDHDDWVDNYDKWEDRFFPDYLEAMASIGYEPEFGCDY